MDQIDLGALLADVANDPRSLPIALAMAVVVLLGLLRRRGARPRTGEIWFADVPFEDGSGSKDRPVLVLAVDGRTCTVARFTSQEKGARRDHLRVPAGIPGLNRTSWVSVRPMRLRRSAMRRRTGRPGAPLVSWYDRATGR